jgi:hypothetical protein
MKISRSRHGPWLATLVFVLLGGAAQAAGDPAALCERAAAQAARQTGVPLSVLQAIALAESGRSADGVRRPWPWTVNFAGKGKWYATRAEAEADVARRQAMGSTSFDIGCFQINHRWHGQEFASPAAMFDPQANAQYAAELLAKHFSKTGNWDDAAAAYHSRSTEQADRYRARFRELHDGLGTAGPLLAGLIRENRFPLLQAGGAGALGSLVPATEAGPGLLGAAP